MTDQSRREFLKKLARGSLYTAPVVATLVTPRSVSGSGKGKGGMSSGMSGGMGMGQQRQLPDAPWFKPVRLPAAGIPATDAEAPSSGAMLK